MSDDEYSERMYNDEHDGGQPYTFQQQASAIRTNGHIVIEGRPCKVVDISTSHDNYHFVGIDIFTDKKLEMTVPSSDNCDVPNLTRVECSLIDITDDDFVSLLTEDGSTKDGVSLPPDEFLFTKLKDKFSEGKNLVVFVMSAMGEERIVSYKEI